MAKAVLAPRPPSPRLASVDARHLARGLYPVARYTATGYIQLMAIRDFARPVIEQFFLHGKIPARAGWGNVKKIAARKLDVLDYAAALADLRVPPGNRLEASKGDLAGFHGIRINDQWRVIFRWTGDGPMEVDIVDYN